ncbi:BlaI/MecI/CopY family transcriptional regulator [Faecalicatena contorta]|uniref:Predicted transcriptional regulator n=1 Tax=Faecalicatena contorta TaxID=39482 RepID=A0A315ZVW4_9FIRM|nr:BlaI/MecI/CopY family transcriptional regulator [Faecalicatena contorta]PWJ49766.1 putative transcriptional regulator [Faecalicatena contorta]SUQ14484.1 Predicted transcriptional regulator [Faecalicatena contorta]
MKDTHLTKSEEDLMEIFWQHETPLTSVEILEITKEHSWNGNYLHVMLRSLQKKGMIKVCGMLQYGNQYARQFEPAVTKAEYGVNLLLSKGLIDSISQVTVALAKSSENVDKKELISQLQEIIEKLKTE